MKKSRLILGFAGVIILVIWLLIAKSPTRDNYLTKAQISTQNIIPTPIPTSIPKQYQFDKSTDLQKELETIKPQVLDSDFE